MSKFISVIIPCRNEEKFIASCLDSILAQNYPLDKVEVLVVDGMSNDGTRAIIQKYHQQYEFIRLVDNPEQITPKALNIGIKNSRGEIIVIMGAHTEYSNDYLTQCVRVLEVTGADNVGGPARTKAQSYMQKAIAIGFEAPFAVGNSKSHDREYEGEIDTVTYGCYRREVFTKFGYFDEELIRNQDDEFNFRLRKAGGRIWQSPTIKSWYYPRDTLKGLFNQYTQYGYWKVKVIQKHKMPASIRHVIPGSFLMALLTTGVLGIFSKVMRLLFGSILGLYLIMTIIATVSTCNKHRAWRYCWIMPLVFMTYHFGYGWGFLKGIWDFVIKKRSGNAKFAALTRN